MQLVEPYNGDQASDAILNIQVPGTAAGDCVVRLKVDSTHYWDMRLDNDVNDRLIFGYGGGTSLILGSNGDVTVAPLSTLIGAMSDFSVSNTGITQISRFKNSGSTGGVSYGAFLGLSANAGGNAIKQWQWINSPGGDTPYTSLAYSTAEGTAGVDYFTIGTSGTVTAVLAFTSPSINLSATNGTGTFTPVLGSLSPASTLQPTWLPFKNGTVNGYIPFYPA